MVAQVVPTMIDIRNFRYYNRRESIYYRGAKKVMPLVWRRRMASGLWEYTFLVDVFGLFKFSFVVYDRKQFKNYKKLMEFQKQ